MSKRIRLILIMLLGSLAAPELHASSPETIPVSTGTPATTPTLEAGPSADSPSATTTAPPSNLLATAAPAERPSGWQFDAWMAIAALALLICLSLAMLLVLLVRRWRAVLQTKEWLLLPSDAGGQLESGMRNLQGAFVKTINQLAAHIEQSASNSEQTVTVAKGLREEFSILRSELESKSKQIAELQLGRDFHSKKSVLIRAIKALEIIEIDMAAGVSPDKTLEGVRIELVECLEDNGIETASPALGEKISDQALVDTRFAQRLEASDPAQKGTVASVSRPAYVARGVTGRMEVLSPARITVFV